MTQPIDLMAQVRQKMAVAAAHAEEQAILAFFGEHGRFPKYSWCVIEHDVGGKSLKVHGCVSDTLPGPPIREVRVCGELNRRQVYE